MLSVRSFEQDFPGAVRCALTETHRLPVHLLRSSTGLMRAGGLVPLLNSRMKTRQNTGELVGASFQYSYISCSFRNDKPLSSHSVSAD